ncbi:hypothetical protein CRENBAI_000767 [Crenichthys baileyi]|uniref:Uncharacterized protein n=1 Tax=Crenichthys baileyi TaxID=28760 RepID=A0AAV9RP08_9TELE
MLSITGGAAGDLREARHITRNLRPPEPTIPRHGSSNGGCPPLPNTVRYPQAIRTPPVPAKPKEDHTVTRAATPPEAIAGPEPPGDRGPSRVQPRLSAQGTHPSIDPSMPDPPPPQGSIQMPSPPRDSTVPVIN